MRGRRTRAVGALVATLAISLAGCSLLGEDAPSPSGSTSATASSGSPEGDLVETFAQPAEGRDWVVLVEDPQDSDRVADDLRQAGLALTSVNRGIGMVTLRSTDDDVRTTAEGVDGVVHAASDQSVGWSPEEEPTPSAEDTSPATGTLQPPPPPEGGDPFDGWLWGMSEINAAQARSVTAGDPDVRVGVIDTGVDSSHPDLVDRVDGERSRSFVTDMPGLDGACERDGCIDPVGSDDNGHGTHVAGTIAASANGIGVQGVAPQVGIVDLRAGQDSGYFFLGPVANAITAGAEQELDVVNMSFYVDPWLYSCPGGAPEDSPAQAAAQDVTIELMHRALDLAHEQGVTLVTAAGNNSRDLADPGIDNTSPNFGDTTHERTLDEDCRLLPLDGPHVVGVSSVDEDLTRSGFSNYTSDPASDDVAIAAPGGAGPESGLPILSTASRDLLLTRGDVDDEGRVTVSGSQEGIVRSCPEGIGETEADPDGQCGLYTWLMGTSMAAPHVSGTAALVISENGGTMAPDEVVQTLRRTARDHECPSLGSDADGGGTSAVCTGPPERNGFFGDGILDAAAAVR
ncbi:S8 family serine peptidase [Janibacter cremeus]|uniref:Subtilisin family serine protease n=1 Tax=Janibacter cremeus TaxID=1285192 RepID=A0A852VPZ4_9MICO|nr:S8 family serine peptidase [Janibacter cremeus]NYF97969.1 subtilisin family serine protease [Janibacter cremeus]